MLLLLVVLFFTLYFFYVGLDGIKQASSIKKRPNIVVATPGRLAELLKSSGGDLPPCFAKLRFLVMDEADRLLANDRVHELDIIMSHLPEKNRQTLLFSATMTKSITALKSASSKPLLIFESEKDEEFEVVESLRQYYIFIPEALKEAYLVYLLKQLIVNSNNEDEDQLISKMKSTCIVFVATCVQCQLISQMLLELEITNVALHSKLDQTKRLEALGRFKSGNARILIATDVASRGLDISSVSRVLNYDVPYQRYSFAHDDFLL